MNLITVSRSVKSYFVPILITVLVVISAGVLLFINRNRTQNALPRLEKTEFDTLPSEVNSINIQNLKAPQNIPDKLPVYKTGQNIDYLVIANSIASKLGFTEKPLEINDINLGNGFIYSNENAALLIYKNNVSYQKLNIKAQRGPFDEGKTAILAKEFLSDLGFDTESLGESSRSFKIVDGDSILESSDPQNSDLLKIEFSHELSGIKSFSPQVAINVSLDVQGQVVSFNFRGLGKFQELNTYPLTGFDDAVKTLTNNGGELVSVETYGGESFTEYSTHISNLQTVDINNASLAYYIPKIVKGDLQPVWVFNGESKVNNTVIKVKISVPAIPEKFLKQTQPNKP